VKQLKQIRENGDVSAEDNKMVELLLKGINVVLLNSKTDLRMGGTIGDELRATLESELQTLFRLTHHSVFRIQLQAFKLLFQFVKAAGQMKFKVDVVADDASTKDVAGTLKDRYYRSLYDLMLRLHSIKAPTQLDEYFSLIFRAIKEDSSVERQAGFVRRML
jgi:hypothetical protein